MIFVERMAEAACTKGLALGLSNELKQWSPTQRSYTEECYSRAPKVAQQCYKYTWRLSTSVGANILPLRPTAAAARTLPLAETAAGCAAAAAVDCLVVPGQLRC